MRVMGEAQDDPPGIQKHTTSGSARVVFDA